MIEGDQSVEYYVDWPVVAALQEWTVTAESQSQSLCIIGPYQLEEQSTISMIAAKYAASAIEAKLPAISYFCELPRNGIPSDSTPEAEALVSLAYSLVRQLIELLPSVFESAAQLHSQRFEVLDGTLGSWDHVVGILKDLLDLSPPVLFCVIDGLEILEDQRTRQPLADFIDALHGHDGNRDDTQVSKRKLKSLFTTAGRSRCLLDYLTEEELVFAEKPSTGRNPGKQASGRRASSPSGYLSRVDGSVPADE